MVRSGWYPAVFSILPPYSHHAGYLVRVSGCAGEVRLKGAAPGRCVQTVQGAGARAGMAACPVAGAVQCHSLLPPPARSSGASGFCGTECRWLCTPGEAPLPPSCPREGSVTLALFLGLCMPAEGARELGTLATDCH